MLLTKNCLSNYEVHYKNKSRNIAQSFTLPHQDQVGQSASLKNINIQLFQLLTDACSFHKPVHASQNTYIWIILGVEALPENIITLIADVRHLSTSVCGFAELVSVQEIRVIIIFSSLQSLPRISASSLFGSLNLAVRIQKGANFVWPIEIHCTLNGRLGTLPACRLKSNVSLA